MGAPDLAVVGAGVFGLSVAWAARRAGLSVRVLEAARVGAGASGGVVGALMPYAPGRWSDLHAFQHAALAALPDRIAAVERDCGRDCGCARCGRLTPLATPEARVRAEADAAAASRHWGGTASFAVLDRVPPDALGWLSQQAAPHGVVHETLSARIDPRACLAALAACLGNAIREGVTVTGVDPAGAALQTSSGPVSAGAVVLAAGWQTWRLAAPFAPRLSGTAVKGQAALLAAATGAIPLIADRGLYVVPHGGHVAVGSTRERQFGDPATTDARLDDVVDRARRLCPALADAPVIERWAGLRPKPPGRTPVAGRIPGHPHLWIAGGGDGIGLGIAHAIADALVAEMAGTRPAIPLPPSFRPPSGP